MAISVNENGAVKVIASQGPGKSIFWYIPDGTTWAQLTAVEYQRYKSMHIDTIDFDSVPSLVRVSEFQSNNIIKSNADTSDIKMTGDSVRYYLLTKDFKPNTIVADGTAPNSLTLTYPIFTVYNSSNTKFEVAVCFALRDHYFDIYIYGSSNPTGVTEGEFKAGSTHTHGFLIEPIA